MLNEAKIFSGFSVHDIAAARVFYRDTLGLSIADEGMGLTLQLPSGGSVFMYEKPDHVPATFTILNFGVDDIDAAVDSLTAKGITMERYAAMPAQQDEKGILRGRAAQMGPDIAWFKDPSGNILAVLQN